LEIWGDGLRMVLSDPYGACRLHIRRPHSEQTETLSFAEDDPYLSEDRAFVDAVRQGDASLIRSPYADAMQTYELTWAIRRASERGD
jgi:predicted dehydrogenase